MTELARLRAELRAGRMTRAEYDAAYQGLVRRNFLWLQRGLAKSARELEWAEKLAASVPA